ncbi:helix-turn-helix domain-containing protein [Robbsia andropogonis]|uniref:helix-turn-helix domain-containing protein n=1 Tax=Robbsia andropogonis TaxID=28092 RepID=UPI003D24E6A2
MKIDNSVGERIVAARAQLNLSQADLAERVGIAPTQLSRYEMGKNRPRIEMIYRLAQALAMSPSGLANGDIDQADRDIYPESEDDPFRTMIALDDELHSAVRDSANKAKRSINDEISERVAQSFAMSERIQELQSVNAALAAGSKSHETSIRLLQQLIQDAGTFITVLVDYQIQKSGKRNDVDDSIRKFGLSLASGKVSEAFKTLGEIQGWAQRNAADLGKFDFLSPYAKISKDAMETGDSRDLAAGD